VSWPDAVNAFFELFSGLFIFHSCWKLYVDKQVKGVSVPATTL
jgi:hypothetical protein